jgi:hypothetical protein
MVHRKLPVLSCQYHPEASPGPHDSRVWFRAFADAIARHGRKRPRPASPALGPARPAGGRARAAAGGERSKGQR